MGPNPAVNLLATPAPGLLVAVVTVSFATKYFPSQSRFRLMLEKLAVTAVGLANVQLASNDSEAATALVQAYQV
jgi:hypothetical protein